MDEPDVEERQGTTGSYGSLTPQDETAEQEKLARARLAQKMEIAFLNRLSPPPGPIAGAEQREFRTRLTNVKLALMKSAWGSDWGDYDVFEDWAWAGAPDPIPAGAKDAADHYRSGQETGT